jgi:hypothetical protein
MNLHWDIVTDFSCQLTRLRLKRWEVSQASDTEVEFDLCELKFQDQILRRPPPPANAGCAYCTLEA